MVKFGCTQNRTSSFWSFEKKKNLLKFFGGLAYLAQRYNRPFDKNPKKLTLFSTPRWPKKGVLGKSWGEFLADPWTFHEFPITEKNFPSQKPKHFWAKIGQNWPKSTMRKVQILRARFCRRARGLILSESKYHGGLPKKSSRSDQPLPSYLLKTISPL